MQTDNHANSRLTPLVAPLNVFLVALITWLYTEPAARGLNLALGPQAEDIITHALGTLLWLAGGWLASRLIVALVLNPISQRRYGTPAPGILANCVSATVFGVVALLMVKFVFGKPIGGLVATSGVVTLVIGFAMRDMIADFFSGIAMNLEQPYRIGDWLELGPGQVGRVTELNWRATRLVTLSGVNVVVPNNNLASRQFINYSQPASHFRESMEIVLNFTADHERVENILLSAVLSTDGLSDFGSHQVRIKGFQERGVVYEVRFWVDRYEDRVLIRHKVAGNVLQFLNQAGISIPYAQHEVVLARQRRPRQERRINARRQLSRIEWLSALTADELDHLADVAISREFSCGDFVVKEGERGSSLYVLVEGVVEATTAKDGSPAIRVGRIRPGQAFGEMSLLTGAPRAASVKALTDVFALQVCREDLEPLLRARPEMTQELGRVMAQRLDDIERQTREGNSEEPQADNGTRAQQIARRISSFFGL